MKIKLKDLTLEQYKLWCKQNCSLRDCDKCLFRNVACSINSDRNWVKNKSIYTDKFLDQEVEIEKEPFLTKKERGYLAEVIKPFKDEVSHISKVADGYRFEYVVISFDTKEEDVIYLRTLPKGKMFKGMEFGKKYTLKDLCL